MSKGTLQGALILAVVVALFLAFRKKACVQSTFIPGSAVAGGDFNQNAPTGAPTVPVQ